MQTLLNAGYDIDGINMLVIYIGEERMVKDTV